MSRIMLVTGGSRGIGAAVCRKAAALNYDVAVNYNSARDRADEIVEDVKKLGQRAIAGETGIADIRGKEPARTGDVR